MKRKVLVALVVTLTFTAAANAGTISGKVSGVSGESVVYIEAIPGKTPPRRMLARSAAKCQVFPVNR